MAMPTIPRSAMAKTVRPDWYRGLQTKRIGDYFGSLSSIAPGETYVTQDMVFIVHRDATTGHFHVSRNACAHAGARLLPNPGVQDHSNILCPLHQWRYTLSGELIAAPFFEKCESVRLHAPDFGVWNGYVLGYKQSHLDEALASFGTELGIPKSAVDPREFVFMEEKEDPLPYPRPTMMINYKDGLHVYKYHWMTFTTVADVSQYLWEMSKRIEGNPVGYSIQVVRARQNVRANMEMLMRQNSTLSEEDLGWARLHLWIEEELMKYDVKYPIDKDIFAIWASIYGNGYVMPEVYEGGLFMVVSYLVNVDPKNSETGNLNFVEYYVHKSIPVELREKAYRLFREAYIQSAEEDHEICLRLWDAHQQGDLEFGRVYHTELEKGDVHWREWFMEHFVNK
jgi:nitrite reductase/ring-hydroxylating ferredoxin subunit